MEIKQFTGISLGSQGKAWARMCGLGLKQLMAVRQLLVELKETQKNPNLLAMVQLIFPLPDPIQVQSQIMLSLGLS